MQVMEQGNGNKRKRKVLDNDSQSLCSLLLMVSRILPVLNGVHPGIERWCTGLQFLTMTAALLCRLQSGLPPPPPPLRSRPPPQLPVSLPTAFFIQLQTAPPFRSHPDLDYSRIVYCRCPPLFSNIIMVKAMRQLQLRKLRIVANKQISARGVLSGKTY
ncbi:PREDICTED: uncharacterized protein LOC105969779 isoform X1 [Erythranthe guttata]|uniref:uncharacterized protein LOC105969779 isoform X1 n=1 Tax=Erythranthe guttata TaxID=4155 RepID=UPI00064DF9A4|nr:PREDICTED: uncharacterized protein LOC105969779 isoform X1 [Erythranthe guttata]|eukprot:XP_012850011.1 PREDICTED: uncharacterized protein LOC105969779 isoform X1 [Erythranthe guttata]